jgi:class 3 adenylate cyclase
MPTQSRQLAAIMFTEIVGNTKLMADDEERALQLLRKNRSLHKSIIRKHHGKWLKEMGDWKFGRFLTAIWLCISF